MLARWAAPLVATLVAERLKPLQEILAGHFDIDDPDAVHDLRVTARRLHAALTVAAPLARFPAGVRRRSLRRIERRLGGLRDLDVLQALAGELPVDHPPVEGLLAALTAERHEARELGLAAIGRRGLRRTAQGLEDWARQPEFTALASQSLEVLLPDLLIPALSAVLLQPAWLRPKLPQPDAPEAGDGHELRRRIKALRYRLECVLPPGESLLSAWVLELREMQRGLGTWHDTGVLLRRLDLASGDDPLATPVRRRGAGAVAAWPEWRARYLDPGYRSMARGWLDPARPWAPGLADPAT